MLTGALRQWLTIYFRKFLTQLLWTMEKIVKTIRTYVNHVKNIWHFELAYPLTKRILLVI